MNDTIVLVVAVAACAVAAHAAWHLWRELPFSNPLFYSVAALEVLLVGVAIGGFVALGRTDRDVDGVLFVSYLLTIVVIPVAATLWGIAEKSRWGSGVVVVAMLTVAVLAVRVEQIWETAHA